MSDLSKKRIARIASVPFALLGSRSVLSFLSKKFDLDVISSRGDFEDEIQSVVSKRLIFIEIKREISPFSDLKTLFNLYRVFRKNKYILTHSNTPKGGLLTAIAAWAARVPIRCHTFTGQRWVTLKGRKRLLLIWCDRLICTLSTNLYADSISQIKFLEESKVSSKDSVKCLGHGGFAGVDLNRFSRSRLININTPSWSKADEFLTICFVGRLVKEKGVEVLLSSFKKLMEKGFKLNLVLIGPYEPRLDPIDDSWTLFIQSCKNIYYLGFLENPEEAMVHCDVICLPSFREGFPMVIIEAASLEVPALVSNIVGSVDTVIHDETGLIFNSNDEESLSDAIKRIYYDRSLLVEMGKRAHVRTVDFFSNEYLQTLYEKEYTNLVANYEKNI
tara:strand:+ start:70985 stop:72151 length:1167 start_codon:yes stop_codon:yes gene_type:complete